MKYEIKLPAISGDIIPLGLVAATMALRDATAGGPDYQQATFDGRLAKYNAMLLRNVRNDNLAVCDDTGEAGSANGIVAQRVAEGTGVVLQSNLRDVDVDSTWLCNVFVKLKALNDWAARRGDEFTVSSEGVPWVEASHNGRRNGVTHFAVRGRDTSGSHALGSQDADAIRAAAETAPTEVKPQPQVGRTLRWWQTEFDIQDMAQNFGAKLHDKRDPKKLPSNTSIAKDIAGRIRDEERRKGGSREAPHWDTVRGALTGWRFKPD